MAAASELYCEKHPFLSKQLIAYIGNKRRLLPLIQSSIDKCVASEGDSSLFVDFFSGSGAVARLAKLSGYDVVANDWEKYSEILNKAFLELNESERSQLFLEHGGLDALLAKLNKLKKPTADGAYISKYYCPEDTLNADPDNERMFYTRENGEKIDAIREWIELHYPGEQSDPFKAKEKTLLLGLLLYEAATHSNTSGVFKGYHRGFGGRGGDALSRIMGDVTLESPQLVDGQATASRADALVLAKRLRNEGQRALVAYLDPPYNQHQYGSNYHLLNTIALNDKLSLNKNVRVKGKKIAKAGIRKDWVKTKSAYCYKKSAEKEFQELIAAIDSHYLLISYSTEGIIPFTKMIDILGSKGRLDIVLSEYTRYRGGKQALTTTVRNVEFVLLVDTTKKNRAEDISRVMQKLGQSKMEIFLKRSVSPGVFVQEGFEVSDFSNMSQDLTFRKELEAGLEMAVQVADFKRITKCTFSREQGVIEPGNMSAKDFSLCLATLERLTSITKEEELSVTINWIKYLCQKGQSHAVLSALPELPYLLKKFNDRKAYEVSLLYLLKILETVVVIKQQNGCICEEKKFFRFVAQLQRIVQFKLAIPLGRLSDQESVLSLRDQVLERWRKLVV